MDMDEYGKNHDVFVDWKESEHEQYFDIWTDGDQNQIEKEIGLIKGITRCNRDFFADTRYTAYVDPRYNRNFLRREIIAVLKTLEEEVDG